MKLLVSILTIIITTLSFAQPQIYFAQAIGDKGIILEDYITFRDNVSSWGKTELGINYDPYVKYMKDIARKYANYSDSVREYVFDSYKPEFKKLTGIKPGARFYVSSEKGVYLTEAAGYYMRLDDEIGGGNIFYVLLKTPMESRDQPVKYAEYEILVCYTSGDMTPIDRTGVTDAGERDKIKNVLMPLLKDVKLSEYQDGRETWKKMESIDDADLRLFKVPLTYGVDENGKLISLYLASFCRQVSSTEFASAILIIDGKGKVLKKFHGIKVKDFNYMKVTGVVDIEGDGVYEIITEDGYYEGSGAGFWQYYGEEFRYVASGFAFGV